MHNGKPAEMHHHVHMDKLCILVANEPRAYRDAIAGALRRLRPHAEVIMAKPDALDAEVARVAPHMVLCGVATLAVQASAITWIELYPRGESLAVISIAGQRSTLTNVDLAALLALVDQTERLARLN